MPRRQNIPFNEGTFFINIVCYNHLPLIEIVNGYELIYNWFNYLKKKGHFINGYVIMPNHIHVLITFVNTSQSINSIVGNGKRFIAYEILNRLEVFKQDILLKQLSKQVSEKNLKRKKRHEIWNLSFDWKECRDEKFLIQKLEYLHDNPCKGKWDLCKAPVDYKHSSAFFYLTGEQGVYEVKNILEINDIEF
jgi:REP element-mobilizing transposase RayT